MRKWRVAILGLGHWYSAYNLARALPEYPRAELIAVGWHDKAQLDEFTGTFDVDGYTDYDALLEHERIDIVHIAAPVSELEGLTIKAARAGKHMILGKPLAMSVEQADRMVEAVETAGVTCFPFQGIGRLRNAELKARIDKGEIGDIVLLHQTSRWSIAEDWYNSGTPGWFVDPRHVPGGAFIDEGIYWIDAFRWLTGSEIVQVEAKIANLVHKDIAVEDWGMATFTFANGVIATLEAAWTINAPRKTGPSPKQNASCGSKSSAHAERSSISSSGRPDAPCWRRAPPTGCSSGSRSRRSRRRRRSRSITSSSAWTTTGRPRPPFGTRADRLLSRWRRTNRRARDGRSGWTFPTEGGSYQASLPLKLVDRHQIISLPRAMNGASLAAAIR